MSYGQLTFFLMDDVALDMDTEIGYLMEEESNDGSEEDSMY